MANITDEQVKQLISTAATMTALVRIKYGNLDPQVYAYVEEAEKFLLELLQKY